MTYKEALDMFCNNYCEDNNGITDCINNCTCRDVLEEAVKKAEMCDAFLGGAFTDVEGGDKK